MKWSFFIRGRRRRRDDALITLAKPFLRHSDLDLADLFDDDCELIDSGGDTSEGRIGRLGWCPCQSEYTVDARQFNFNAKPNKAQHVPTPRLRPLQSGSAPMTAFRC